MNFVINGIFDKKIFYLYTTCIYLRFKHDLEKVDSALFQLKYGKKNSQQIGGV